MNVFSEYLKERFGDEIIRFMRRVESYSKDYHDSDMHSFNQITSPTSPTLSVNTSTISTTNVNTKQQQRNERQLRRSLKHLVLKAKEIIDEFVELESNSELNLGATVQSKTLEKWDSILALFNNYLKDSGRASEMIRHSGESDTLSSGSGKDLNNIQSPDTLTISSGSLSSSSTCSSGSASNSGSGGSGNFDSTPHDKSAQGMSILTTISYQLDPEDLFGQAMLMASVDLKMSHFQSFSKSEFLMKFLKEKGEKYTRTMGVDISKGYNVDLRFKPQDLRVPTITDDYIYFGLGLCEETPDWELVTKDSKLNYSVYTSKTSYLFDNSSKGMKLSKIVIDLEYPIEDLWAIFCHTENQMEFDSMCYKEHECHGYVPPNSDPKNPCPYGLQKISCNFDIKLPMAKKRHMKMVGTTIHDSGTDMIMIVKHACDYESSQSSTDEFSKNSLPVDTLLSYYIMFRCGEFKNSTRLYHIMYTDLQLPLQEFTSGKLMTKRAKMLSQGMNKILENLTYRGKISVDTSCIIDQFGYSSAARDNMSVHQGRSWYNEWFEKKKGVLPESPESSTNTF